MVHYTDVDILRLSRRWSILPEITQLTGIETFTKLANFFGGVTVTFPTPKDIARLRTERNILDRAEHDASYAALHAVGTSSGSNDGDSICSRLGKATMSGHHETAVLYKEELELKKEYEALGNDN